MKKEEIDQQLETIYKISKLMFEESNKVLNYRSGSKRYDELHNLTKGLQQFVIDYEKWEKKRGEHK
jgi:hypothetical protein